MRKTGILMPVSSLPSKTGAGQFGKEAYKFLKILKENGIGIWQILPLNPAGYGNSPYQPYSSFAGDDLYISLEELANNGLLKEMPPSYREKEATVDYAKVRNFREPYLREAYHTFVEQGKTKTKEYQEFLSQGWVFEYGVFRALKQKNGERCWNEWEKHDRDWPQERTPLQEETKEEASYQMFLQYLFSCQWEKLKKTANEIGIEIMGDVPFYVGVDSVDVWANRENFLIGADHKPTFVAGVPPDYFSVTGQRWGNPIYNWEYLKETNYAFWVERIGHSSLMFDIVRIDHFRAFDTFWKIPASCKTAMEGAWIEAPGYEVLDCLQEQISNLNLVAEDLGDLRQEVLDLKNHYHLKGMKVLQFCIDTKKKYARDTFQEEENLIIYSGTHDNDTLLEWYRNLTTASKRKLRRFLKKEGCLQGSIKDKLLQYVLQSKAAYAIIPMWDFLGLGKEGHMNTPGTVGSPNWEWRMPEFQRAEQELQRYRMQIKKRAYEKTPSN